MTEKNKTIPVVSIVGKSNTGKTTLIERIIPELNRRGYRVATIKHHGHGFEADEEGKDTWRHKQAGARMTVFSSPRRVAVVEDVERDQGIEELLAQYVHDVDLVLTEGFKKNTLPKIEVFRADRKEDLLSRDDAKLLAVVGDKPPDLNIPWFDREDVRGIVDMIETRFLR